MELEELKKVWNVKEPEVTYSKQALRDIFEVRTKRAVSRINRNMLWDGAFMILATIGFIAVTFALGLKDRFMISGELLLIATVLGIHYRIKHLTINKFHFANSGIVTSIRRITNKLKGYIILYKILIPTLSAALYLLYCLNVHFYKYGSYSLSALNASSIITVLLITVICYLITRRITQIMYGKELQKLQELSREFDTPNS